MPKTKFQEFIFTLITSGCMIFIMGVYNVAICTGGLQAATFKHALHSFPLEWFIRNHRVSLQSVNSIRLEPQ